MRTNKDVLFPYYSGYIKFTKAMGYVSLSNFIHAHKTPNKDIAALMDKIQEASESGDLKLKRELKQKLYSFTPSVEVGCVGTKRKYDNITGWTGLMQLDFDKIETVAKAHDLKEYLFTTYQCVVCAYMSPSGKGVKCLISITKPRDKEHYRAIYKSVQKEFESIGYFDPATKNAILPLFLSIDKDIYSRDISEAITWNEEDWTEEKKVQLLDKPPTSNFVHSNKDSHQAQYDYDKCIRIFTEAMNSIVDNGHPQLRHACLILGSRASAGYISKNEAISMCENAVLANSYFDKDQKGYIDTAHWAVEQGYKSPKYYK
jgi:hypothetical protein